jgi:uncharacterized protein (DUF934 family)
MRRILRRREIITDDWGDPPDGPADPRSDGSLIVPWSQFREDPQTWIARPGRLGVRVGPAVAIEELAGVVPRLSLVAVEFPGPAEGRGFSQGSLLRTRLKFTGELRAVGAGVKQDLLFLMHRCGFDSYELAPGQSFEAALRALERYTVAYQPGALREALSQQRFFA